MASANGPSQAIDASSVDPNSYLANPAIAPVPGAVGPADIGNPASTPSVMALPVQPTGSTTIGTGGPAVDASNMHKFYTFSVDLRETYDDNVGTSNSNKQSSLETSISPSVLVSFPIENSNFSAGYTFSETYYSQTAGTGNNLQYSNSFNAQYSHTFSDRFSLTAGDSLVDSPEPNIYGTTGTPYRDGQNVSNAFNAGLSAQWTPLIGSQTTYANTIVRYLDEAEIAATQDNMENTASQSVSFTVTPTISGSLGGVYDNTSYDQDPRGYTSYTGFIGGSWGALPNVNASLRVGGTYTESTQQEGNGPTTTSGSASPYADISASWAIGKNSSLSGDYSHEVTPSDYAGSSSQESDRLSGSFSYTVTPQVSTHFQVSYSYNTVSQSQIYSTSNTSSYDETVYSADAGASYNFIKYFSLNFDISESGVSSGIPDSSYNREEVSFGVRGTY